MDVKRRHTSFNSSRLVSSYSDHESSWKPLIKEQLGLLENMASSSEKGFLAIGAKLLEIQRQTMNVSSRLSDQLQQFTSSNTNDTFTGLESITMQSTGHLNQLESTLSGVLENLIGLEQPIMLLPEYFANFESLVKRLRVMGITTRIETARIGEDGAGFVHLAEAVSTLGENIMAKDKEVRLHLKEIGAEVQTTNKKLVDLKETYHTILQHVSSDMQSNLQLLSEKQEMYGKTLTGISQKSDDAIKNLGNVVQAIQFHDITRQQVEHVVDALRGLFDLDEATDEAIAEAVPICEIQAAQLKRASKEFENAVLVIITGLGGLANAINMMVLESEQLTDFTKDTGSSFFANVESRLEGVVGALTQGSIAIRTMISSLNTVSEKIMQMKLDMDQMSDIGSEIELLALNSRVRAAKTGERGAALGIIAESIQHLSTDSRSHIDLMIGQITELVDVSGTLTMSISSIGQSGEDDPEILRLKENIHTTIRTLHETNTDNARVFVETEKSCQAMSVQLEKMATEINSHLEYSYFLNRMSDSISSIAFTLRTSVSDEVRSEIDQRLENLKSKYTMNTEREIHAAVLGQTVDDTASGSSEEGSIELF